MIVALDVQYGVTAVTTAVVGWRAWPDAIAAFERVERHATPPAPYVPGAFVERELPYLLAALAGVAAAIAIETIVIDGHVWLGADRQGLGAHLHDHTHLPVIGVAKNAFVGAPSLPVIRGDSARPLHVTAAGIDPAVAAAAIASMHGPYRHPTLLKRADSLARSR